MMQHELQARLDAGVPGAGGAGICILGVDPGTVVSGLQRMAPWWIRVLSMQILYPIIQYFYPASDLVRTAARSAGDILEAAFGAVGPGGEPPRDMYFNGRTPAETGPESRDAAERAMVWAETAKLAGLRDGETVLANWR